jgi:lipopolysaccharide transport system permease protein
MPGAPDAVANLPRTIIECPRGWQIIDLGELWRYRELLFFLTWRDVKVRYKQTVLGAAWAVVQPLATMVVFSLFFGRMASGAPSDPPYPLFVLSGLVPWMFFANAISSASQSVIGNQNLVTKIFFPRLIIPFAAVGASLVDFAITFVLLFVMMLGYGVSPDWGMLLVPLFSLLLMVAATGVGTLLAALTVAYRDFRYVVPFMLQLWMFATPIIYLQANALSPRLRPLLAFNPAYGLISAFRRAFLGGPLDWYDLTVSCLVGVALLLAGLFYYQRVEHSFSDII